MQTNEESRKRQRLVAVSTTISAALLGVAMVFAFHPVIVLCVIIMACCAQLQWTLYLNMGLQSRMDDLVGQDRANSTTS